MSVEDDLEWLLQAAYEQGLDHGFTIGRGKRPRPEDTKALLKVAEATKGKLKVALEAAKEEDNAEG